MRVECESLFIFTEMQLNYLFECVFEKKKLITQCFLCLINSKVFNLRLEWNKSYSVKCFIIDVFTKILPKIKIQMVLLETETGRVRR